MDRLIEHQMDSVIQSLRNRFRRSSSRASSKSQQSTDARQPHELDEEVFFQRRERESSIQSSKASLGRLITSNHRFIPMGKRGTSNVPSDAEEVDLEGEEKQQAWTAPVSPMTIPRHQRGNSVRLRELQRLLRAYHQQREDWAAASPPAGSPRLLAKRQRRDSSAKSGRSSATDYDESNRERNRNYYQKVVKMLTESDGLPSWSLYYSRHELGPERPMNFLIVPTAESRTTEGEEQHKQQRRTTAITLSQLELALKGFSSENRTIAGTTTNSTSITPGSSPPYSSSVSPRSPQLLPPLPRRPRAITNTSSKGSRLPLAMSISPPLGTTAIGQQKKQSLSQSQTHSIIPMLQKSQQMCQSEAPMKFMKLLPPYPRSPKMRRISPVTTENSVVNDQMKEESVGLLTIKTMTQENDKAKQQQQGQQHRSLNIEQSFTLESSVKHEIKQTTRGVKNKSKSPPAAAVAQLVKTKQQVRQSVKATASGLQQFMAKHSHRGRRDIPHKPAADEKIFSLVKPALSEPRLGPTGHYRSRPPATTTAIIGLSMMTGAQSAIALEHLGRLKDMVAETKYVTAVFESRGGFEPVLEDINLELDHWLGPSSRLLSVACEVHWSVPERFRSRKMEIQLKETLHAALRENNRRIIGLNTSSTLSGILPADLSAGEEDDDGQPDYEIRRTRSRSSTWTMNKWRLPLSSRNCTPFPISLAISKTEENCARDIQLDAFQGIYRRYYPALLSIQDPSTVQAHAGYWTLESLRDERKHPLLPSPARFLYQPMPGQLACKSVVAVNMAVLRLHGDTRDYDADEQRMKRTEAGAAN